MEEKLTMLPVPLFDHAGHHVLGHQPDALDVDVEDRVEVGRRGSVGGSCRADDAGGVDQDVRGAQFVADPADGVGDAGLAGDVDVVLR